MLLPPMVCSAWLLVVGGQVQGSRLSVQAVSACLQHKTRRHSGLLDCKKQLMFVQPIWYSTHLDIFADV